MPLGRGSIGYHAGHASSGRLAVRVDHRARLHPARVGDAAAPDAERATSQAPDHAQPGAAGRG
jgi:hypothetical protein